MMKLLILFLALCFSGFALQPNAQPRLDDVLRDGFQYRNLGPFRVGGWVAHIAVPETPLKAHLYTFYVAARHGGGRTERK